MTTPTKDLESIERNLLAYLAEQGLACMPVQVQEIRARLNGHLDHAAATRYADEQQHFWAYKLDFRDVSADQIRLAATLSSPPLVEGLSRELTVAAAARQAIELAHPVVVCNGAHECLDVLNEPEPANGYSIYRPLGEVYDDSPTALTTQAAEDFDLVDAGFRTKVAAVEAMHQVASLPLPYPELSPLLFAVTQSPYNLRSNADGDTVFWKLTKD